MIFWLLYPPLLTGKLESVIEGNARVMIKLSNSPLSLGGHDESQRNEKLCFSHGKSRPDANSVQGLPCKNKAFYSAEVQHDRRVIKVFLVTIKSQK